MKTIGSAIARARGALAAFVHVTTALRLVWNTRPGLMLAIVALSLCASAIPATNLWISKNLLDAVAQAASQPNVEGAYHQMVWLLGWQVLLAAAAALLNGLNGSYRELLTTDVTNNSVLMILRKAVSLDLEVFQRSETHDTLRTALGQVGSRPVSIWLQVVAIGQSLLVLTTVGALMSRLGVGVFAIVVLAALPSVFVANRFGVLSYRQSRRRAPDLRAQNYLVSLLTSDHAAKEIRTAGTEDRLLDRWEQYRSRLTAELRSLSVARTCWTVAASITSAALIVAATMSVVRQASAGQVSVGEFSVLTMGIAYVQSQLGSILSGVAGLYEHLLHMGTLAEFLALPSARNDDGDEWQGQIETIEFDDVSYRYSSAEHLVLDSVSFTARRGQSIAIVGANGSGKSTLVRLLSRLALPTGGRIVINGQDASRFNVRSLRREISVMFQDHVRYSMTLRDNIVFGDVHNSLDEHAMRRAAQDGGVVDFMGDWEAGFDTPLGQLFPRSRELSGGEWQRVALARLYFKRCSIYVLDEPTASLDIDAERRTAEYLRARSRNHIVIVVTHNPTLIALVDRVLVLRDGRLTEMPQSQTGSSEDAL